MAVPVEDPKLRRDALVYVIRVSDELIEENGAPTLGTQKPGGRFHPGRSRAVPRRRGVGPDRLAPLKALEHRSGGRSGHSFMAGHLRMENSPSPSGRRGDQGFLIPVKLHTSGS